MGDTVVESFGVAKLEHHGHGVVGFEDVVDLENVGVGSQEGHDLGLFLEASAVGFVSEDGLIDDLDGDGLGGDGAVGAEDGAESAAADFFEELVGVFECVVHLRILGIGGFWFF